MRQPLCKFGPGGDFTRDFSLPVNDAEQDSEITIAKVLSAITDIIGAAVSTETPAEMQNRTQAETPSYKIAVMEKLKVEPKKSKPGNTPATRGSKRCRRVRGQAMLFSDDSRDSRRAKRKPNNRIRAHRRTSRKKIAHQFKGQGTLFENYPAGTTAA